MSAVDESNGIKKLIVRLAAPAIVLLMIQTGTLIWWASSIDTRMAVAEKQIDEVKARVCTLERAK